MAGCTKLLQLIKVQKGIIERHIDEHKWFNHIQDKNKGIADFIKKYGWIMKEVYCELCEDNGKCESYIKFKETNNIKHLR